MAQISRQQNLARYHKHLSLEIHDRHPTHCRLTATVMEPTLTALYGHAITLQQEAMPTQGLHKSEIPQGYVEFNYKHDLLEHLKEFLLKYSVLGFICEEIRMKKIPIAGEPRLMDIVMKPPHQAEYHFELSLYPQIPFQEWKFLPFVPPKRKNYKDLDRQVELFLDEEAHPRDKSREGSIQIGDWVNFSLTIYNKEQKSLVEDFDCRFWLKIGDEEADRPFQELFLDKKIGTTFCQKGASFQYYFNEPLACHYTFCIAILDIVPYSFFSVDQFKHQFRLKSNKEVNEKMIEVFSYRNEMSLRRCMVEDALKLLFSKYSLEIPSYLILRQQKTVLEAIQDLPDFHVYRAQRDFNDQVRQLAERQAREQVFIDQLAYYENITVSSNDIKGYLNLTKRPRTKDFLYFDPPTTKVKSQELPIVEEELKRVCMREKTLNYVIYHLTKQD